MMVPLGCEPLILQLTSKGMRRISSIKVTIITLVDAVLPPIITLPGTMRPLNPLRDLMAVADLIELCFHGTMDAEGRGFLSELRRSARGSGFSAWASRTSDMTSVPLSGFVWEDDGRIIGNVSLIPFRRHGQRVIFVANVAVHPDYRRRGIARHLTRRALLAAQEKRGYEVWLQVRDDNPGAVSLYEELGWREQARRTTWRMSSSKQAEPPSPALQVNDHGVSSWAALSRLFERTYPRCLSWYYATYWDSFRPGFWHSFQRFVGDLSFREWSAYDGRHFSGMLVAQLDPGYGEHLWAAVPPDGDAALHALLVRARSDLSRRRTINFEYPADEGVEAIRKAGFVPYRTLIWMKAE
jgi:ribosomal protein S18 acetylase RimI-like enzyme